jgi:hypothetical protein
MGFRFHHSLRVLPGVRLNLSKGGVSASVGIRGAWFTIGQKGTRATVGLPGTGLSYTSYSPFPKQKIEMSSTADAAPDPGKSEERAVYSVLPSALTILVLFCLGYIAVAALR